MSEFFQDAPRLGNQYDDDALLRAYLRWRLPAKMHAEIEPELRRLGHRVVADIFALGEAAESSPQRWCARELAPLVEADAEHRAGSDAIENG